MAMIIQGRVQRSRLLPAVARVLGVSVAYLIGETDEAVRPGAAGALTTAERDLLEKVRALSAADKQIAFRLADSLAQALPIDRKLRDEPA